MTFDAGQPVRQPIWMPGNGRPHPGPDLLCRIPGSARIVLHVGCGDGRLGASFRQRNPTARIIGVTANGAMAERLGLVLDEVVVADTPAKLEADLSAIAPGSIDCVIGDDWRDCACGFDQLVRCISAQLTPDATILLRLPNADRCEAAEDMLRGTHREPPAGLALGQLEPTDFQIRGTLRQAGFAHIDKIAVASDDLGGDEFAAAATPMLARLGVDPGAYRRRAAASAHIWRARRGRPRPALTVASTMLNPVGGVSDVRVVQPMQALKAEAGLNPILIGSDSEVPTDIAGPRIFVFHRPLLAGDSGLLRIKALIDKGWLVVCEFDDHPDYIPVLRRPDVQNFRAVHAVQTTTDALAAVFRSHNPEVAVFQNAVEELPALANFADMDRMTLFFAGLNRDQDWPAFMPAINAVARRFGRRLHFEVVNDRHFFDSLETRYKNFTPLCDYEVYQDILARCEISFMPLSDTTFNHCKSDLKFIEAAAHGVAALASQIVYSGTAEHGRTAALFGNPPELEALLTSLVARPDGAKAIALAARQYIVETRMLSQQLEQRAAWYRSLWARRDELQRMLVRRVPEFAN